MKAKNNTKKILVAFDRFWNYVKAFAPANERVVLERNIH